MNSLNFACGFDMLQHFFYLACFPLLSSRITMMAAAAAAIHIVKFMGIVVARKTIYEFKSIFERHTRTVSANKAKYGRNEYTHALARSFALLFV